MLFRLYTGAMSSPCAHSLRPWLTVESQQLMGEEDLLGGRPWSTMERRLLLGGEELLQEYSPGVSPSSLRWSWDGSCPETRWRECVTTGSCCGGLVVLTTWCPNAAGREGAKPSSLLGTQHFSPSIRSTGGPTPPFHPLPWSVPFPWGSSTFYTLLGERIPGHTWRLHVPTPHHGQPPPHLPHPPLGPSCASDAHRRLYAPPSVQERQPT